MGDPKGFLKYSRNEAGYRPVEERVKDFTEVAKSLNTEERILQAARCMDCGVPFCHWQCPLHNQVPDFQDAVYRREWAEAYRILRATNNFPEFTGRICPALCEHGCVLGSFGEPVTIRENEIAVVERAYKDGLVKPIIPQSRSGKKIAIIGSGPAGLAAADDLNQAGHEVTVFEQDDKVGGLLRYGIPDFKLDKQVIDRRVGLMVKEGIEFETNVRVGVDIKADDLLNKFDIVVLTIGAMVPRDLPVPGRDLKGVYFAMDYLKQQNKKVRGQRIAEDIDINAKNKHVVVIGGGDTGSDCVGTAIRQNAKSVSQVEIMPEPPIQRDNDNPWPYYANVLRTSSSHQEGCDRYWSLATKSFEGKDGKINAVEMVGVEWTKGDGGKMNMVEQEGTNKRLDADLVFLALGFTNPVHEGVVEQFKLGKDERGNLKVNHQHQTTNERVFSAGDAVQGASLVVKAIAHGKDLARSVDEYIKETV